MLISRKISLKKKRVVKKIQYKRFLRSQRNKVLTYKQEEDSSISFSMPSVFNIETNYTNTMNSIYDLRKLYSEEANDNILVKIEDIRDIGQTASLILAAELYRWKRTRSSRLKPNNVRLWSNEIKHIFKSFGLYSLLGIKERLRCGNRIRYQYFKYKTDTYATGKLLSDFYAYLVSKVGCFNKRIYDSLIEAVTNVVQHSCDDTCDLDNIVKNRWWLAAAYDTQEHILKIIVYDQGVGITKTLPKREGFLDLIKGLGEDKGTWIKAAMEVGKSSTKLPYRGKGLSQILAYIKDYEEGIYLKIISGDGFLCYNKSEQNFQTSTNDLYFNGTLIEWAIRINKDVEKN